MNLECLFQKQLGTIVGYSSVLSYVSLVLHFEIVGKEAEPYLFNVNVMQLKQVMKHVLEKIQW